MNANNSSLSGHSTSEYSSMLLSAVAGSHNSMEQIVGIGYKMLENPIVIKDKGCKVVSMTRNIEIKDDSHWNELLADGYLSAESVMSGIRENLVSRIEQEKGPFIYQGSGMKYPRLISSISLNGISLGTISVMGYFRPFEREDYFLLELLCNAVKAEFQKSSSHQLTRGMLHEEFVESLFDGKLGDPDVITARARLLNIGIKKNAYVFVFDLSGYDPEHFSITYMRDNLEKMISGGRALIYNNKIVIITSFSRARDVFKSELAELDLFLKKHDIRCGISRRCPALHELRLYYEQALNALRVGTCVEPDRHIYPYGEYAIYHAAEICCESGMSKALIHPALLTLISYDKEYGTAFTFSLYAYLSHFKSLSQTAAVLNLHRNTLLYHIQRAEEIMEIDLSNYKSAQLIGLSFRMLEYENKLDFKTILNGTIEKEG